jgi:hypothetical protein
MRYAAKDESCVAMTHVPRSLIWILDADTDLPTEDGLPRGGEWFFDWRANDGSNPSYASRGGVARMQKIGGIR